MVETRNEALSLSGPVPVTRGRKVALTALTSARRAGFNILDALRGSPVRRALAEMQWADTAGLRDPLVRARRDDALNRLLGHATSTVPAYRGLDASQGLAVFPVVNKQIIRERGHDARSSSKFKKTFVMRTSGSTGSPFEIAQDERKKRRVNAESIYYPGKLGWRVGEPLPYLRATSPDSKVSFLKQWLTNNEVLDISNLGDDNLSLILSRLNEQQGSMVLSYASSLDAIAYYCHRTGSKGRKGAIKGIVSGSEPLLESTRASLTEVFECPVISRYSNQENGFLAQEEATPGVFYTNTAHYVIEVLDLDKDIAAAPGELGRIVVTDLFNFLTPMVRYDTGDVGRLVEVEADGVIRQTIQGLEGRRWDHLTATDGSWISQHSLTNHLRNYAGIRDFQFVQETPTKFLLRLAGPDTRSPEKSIRQWLSTLLGAGSEISVTHEESIPRAKSGKRIAVVNQTL